MEIGITRLSSEGKIIIPKEMCEEFEEGEKLVIIKKENEIVLKKHIPETALLSEISLAESWLSKEDEDAFAYLQK